MSIKRRAAMALIMVASILATSASVAGDCRQVKFKFTNKWKVADIPVEIKVKKVAIEGNDGDWNEDINNHRIDPSESYTTNQRKLNGLDSGEDGTFTVEFDYRSIGPGWESGNHGPFVVECRDGQTIPFTIMHN